MKPYILRQGVFHFIDGSLSCPPPRVVAADSVSLQINNSFWKQQNQLILSALLFLFFNGCTALLSIVKPCIVFGVLLSKPSFLCLILVVCNFMVLFKIFDRWWFDHYIYAKSKGIIWWISCCWPASFTRGLQFVCVSWSSGWVQRLDNKPRDWSRTFFNADLHSHLLIHEFLHKTSL